VFSAGYIVTCVDDLSLYLFPDEEIVETQFIAILAHFGLPVYAPRTIAVNVSLHGWKEDSMLVKSIAAYTHLSSTVYEL